MLFRVYFWKFRLSFNYIRVIMRYFAKAPRYFAIPRNLSFTYENELNQNLFWMMLEYDRLKVLFLLNFLTLFNIVLASIENNELRELTTNFKKNIVMCAEQWCWLLILYNIPIGKYQNWITSDN